MIRTVLFGAGRMGALHARNAFANPRFDLAYVVDPNEAAATRLAQTVGAKSGNLDTVLDDGTVEAAIIASSTDAHLDDALTCLEAGKAVFCEKPLSLSAEALERSAARLSDPALPPLLVGFNRRFDPHLSALQRRLAAGEIGALESLHIVNHDPAAPSLDFIPRSGGLFRDFTIHDFDMADWLLGLPIVEVFAFASCVVDPAIAGLGDVDTAKTLLRTSRGSLCMISNSRRTGYGYDQRVEAFGAGGALRVGNVRSDVVERWDSGGPTEAPFPYGFADRYAEAYRLELDHFADTIQRGVTPRTGFGASLRAIRLADAAARSAAEGRPIPLEPGETAHA